MCVATLVAGSTLTWAATSSATPDFPAVVAQYLSLPSLAIDPPQGCKLCHPTDAGGTSLSPFGTLVLQDGAVPYDESSLRNALAQIELDDPQLIDDIKAGRDPNSDPNAGNVHAPQYGCGLAQKAEPTPWVIAAAVALALGASARRRAGLRHRQRSVS
jgi:hypothetical protein